MKKHEIKLLISELVYATRNDKVKWEEPVENTFYLESEGTNVFLEFNNYGKRDALTVYGTRITETFYLSYGIRYLAEAIIGQVYGPKRVERKKQWHSFVDRIGELNDG